MVATISQAFRPEFYLERQRSYRHPNEYYRSGEEADGVWWNPSWLFGLEDGARIDSRDFFRLHGGVAPDGTTRLTNNSGSTKRSAGVDLAFNADKSVSALWAIADAGLRADIERAHKDAVRTALDDVIRQYCGVTRTRDRQGSIHVISGDILAALFQQGTSRENDPHLQTNGVIFNVVRSHRDGKFRSLHQKPIYRWMKVAGAAYRNALAWNLRARLGIRMEQYGPDKAFTRIVGMPEDLAAHWSKRRATISKAAGPGAFYELGPGNKPARGLDRHARWHAESEAFVNPGELIGSLLGREFAALPGEGLEPMVSEDDLLRTLAVGDTGVRLSDIVQQVENMTAGLFDRPAVARCLEWLLDKSRVVSPGRVELGNERRAWR